MFLLYYPLANGKLEELSYVEQLLPWSETLPECCHQKKHPSTDIKRNSIVFVKNPFPGSAGSHIMQGDHYAVVCQNNMGNRYSDSVIICYITSKVKRLDIRTNVPIQWYAGLDYKPAMIKCGQIMTIDRDDIIDVVDTLRPEDEIRFNLGLKVSLDLKDNIFS